jgi:hypothetical protein
MTSCQCRLLGSVKYAPYAPCSCPQVAESHVWGPIQPRVSCLRPGRGTCLLPSLPLTATCRYFQPLKKFKDSIHRLLPSGSATSFAVFSVRAPHTTKRLTALQSVPEVSKLQANKHPSSSNADKIPHSVRAARIIIHDFSKCPYDDAHYSLDSTILLWEEWQDTNLQW